MSASSASLPSALCAAAVLAACAQPCGAPQHELRVTVRTQEDWPDAGALAQRVSQIAQLPVRDAAAASTRLFGMTLVCADADGCRAGLQRMMGARGVIAEAGIEERGKVPRPVVPPSGH